VVQNRQVKYGYAIGGAKCDLTGNRGLIEPFVRRLTVFTISLPWMVLCTLAKRLRRCASPTDLIVSFFLLLRPWDLSLSVESVSREKTARMPQFGHGCEHASDLSPQCVKRLISQWNYKFLTAPIIPSSLRFLSFSVIDVSWLNIQSAFLLVFCGFRLNGTCANLPFFSLKRFIDLFFISLQAKKNCQRFLWRQDIRYCRGSRERENHASEWLVRGVEK